MENWEKQEGLIPKLELWKGFRGIVLWVIAAVVFYYTASHYVFDILATEMFVNAYGSLQGIPDIPSLIYYIVNPVLKVIVAIVFASVLKGILNSVLERKNRKIEEKNVKIITKNLAEDGTYIGTQNLDEVARLQLRLEKGKMELGKYEMFFKKKDFAQSFYYWKKSYSVIVGIASYMITYAAAYAVVLVLAMVLSILSLVAGIEIPDAAGEFVVPLIQMLAIAGAIVVGIGSMPFAKKMQKKADLLLKEDEEKGYTEALKRVLWDVPARYRRRTLINKLIRVVRKKRVTTVEEAIKIYERNLAIKKGIIAIIYILAMFGVANAVNNWFNEWEADSKAIANDIGKRMDESRAESERIRETDRRVKEMYNRAGAAQDYANKSKANAASLRGTNQYGSAAQWANKAQKDANAAWDELKNFRGR